MRQPTKSEYKQLTVQGYTIQPLGCVDYLFEHLLQDDSFMDKYVIENSKNRNVITRKHKGYDEVYSLSYLYEKGVLYDDYKV